MNQERVLIVDDDPTIVWTLGRNLARRGFFVVAATDAEEGLQQLERDSYDFVILDIQMKEVSGFVLFDHCRRYAPGAKTIVLLDPGVSTAKETSLAQGADYCIKKPVDIKSLLDIMCQADTKETFTAEISHVDLFDYIQFILFSRQQKVMEISSKTGEKGKIYFEQGNVVHAECSGKEGEDAFYYCLSFDGGSFCELPWQDPPLRSVSVPGEFLLMEAARMRDESREGKRKSDMIASLKKKA